MNEKKQNPIAVLLQLTEDKKEFAVSVVFAMVGVAAGVVPYFMGARIIVALMAGNRDMAYFRNLCVITLLAYVLKVVFANVSTTVSHHATYKTLKSIP